MPDKEKPKEPSAFRRAFNVVALAVGLAVAPVVVAPTVVRVLTDDNKPKPRATEQFNRNAPSAAAAQTPAAQPPRVKVEVKPVPASAFTPMFATDDEKERNIFYKQTARAIREFRALRDQSPSSGPLTREERTLIQETTKAARADAKKYKLPLEVAASLRFASSQVGVDHDTYMQRLTQFAGNLTNADPAGLLKGDVFKFNVPNWLSMIKQFGPSHGLDYFADKIRLDTSTGKPLVDVSDPAVLRQIVNMRHNPRINALMGAELMKHPELKAAEYRGTNWQYDANVAREQQALQTLGFDLGIRGNDGIKGPLMGAAMSEFALMSQPLFGAGKNIDQMLQESAAQAVVDSQKYTNKWNNVTPANAFAVRHAAKVVGVDYGYMMELASAESGFAAGAQAETSSAKGLFQFTDDSWMTMMYLHGAKYGFADIAKNIDVTKNRDGIITSARINDPLISHYALDLRADPRVNALMGAEFAKENKMLLEAAMPKRQVNRTDQYLAHFLGSGSAVDFLTKMKKNPEAAADSAFPAAAGSNKPVFYKPDGTARTLKEVYEVFDKKFDLGVYDPPKPPPPKAPVKPKKR
ncbi:MAG: hypothetical protein ACAH80_01210 [Alphaproteobacteria bacterium]